MNAIKLNFKKIKKDHLRIKVEKSGNFSFGCFVLLILR